MKKIFQICTLFIFLFGTLFLFANPLDDAQENFDKMIVLADKVDSSLQSLNKDIEKLLEYHTVFEATRGKVSIEDADLGVDRIVELMNRMEKFKKAYKYMEQLGW